MSDSAVQEYMTRCPTFIVPSFRTIGRYLRSFYRNFSVPVMHEHYERTGRVIAALRLAILALGARFLLELRSSVALFNASRDIVLNHWTWSTQNASLEDDKYVSIRTAPTSHLTMPLTENQFSPSACSYIYATSRMHQNGTE